MQTLHPITTYYYVPTRQLRLPSIYYCPQLRQIFLESFLSPGGPETTGRLLEGFPTCKVFIIDSVTLEKKTRQLKTTPLPQRPKKSLSAQDDVDNAQ